MLLHLWIFNLEDNIFKSKKKSYITYLLFDDLKKQVDLSIYWNQNYNTLFWKDVKLYTLTYNH